METKIIKIDQDNLDHKLMQEAGDLIAAGELVAFPTETVYGLGGDALDPEASKKIYSAKGRPSDNPLIVHISDFSDLERVAKTVPEDARKLSDAFWPGPLTMIVEKGDAVPYATTGGMDTVAVRMPNHPIALDLIRRSGCLIAAPSANTSGRPSPTEAAHVAEDLSGKIAMIIDGGPVGIGIESTIIDLTEDTPMVLRPGYITPQMLSKVLGKDVIIDPGIIAADDNRKPKAPGMKYKHYAPKADMVIVDGTRKHVIAKINELVASHRDDGKKIAVIATEETKQFYDADVVLSMGSRADEDSIAHELYRILRDCDELDVDVIFSESFSTPRIGQAIMNRMLKAAGHQVIDTHVKYDKIIFVAQTGTCREQMAKGIMNDFVLKVPMEIEARGLVVQFPEPVNQKAEAVLISNGISTEGMVSTQLDTRFSKFSEADDDFTDLGNAGQPPVIKGAADILELFERIKKENEKTADSEQGTDDITEEQAEADVVKLFVFDKFDDVRRISHVLDGFYSGRNDLYRDASSNKYYLVAHKSEHTPKEFNKVCNIISEYAYQKNYVPANEAFFKEHGNVIIEEAAIQTLAAL